MKQHTFDIELQQPVIISQQAATVGSHQSLDYIAGSALLGLVASRLYIHLNVQDAFTIFHSGKVRFLDAFPVLQSEQAYPVPFCLHSFKGEKYSENQQLLKDKVFNIAYPATELNERQSVQLRNFYITASGQKVNPSKEQTLKTAIDARDNRAAESQLFGYEALSLGQKFRFSIQIDQDVNADLQQKILKVVVGSAHLGRSRSAEFGRVNIAASQHVQQLNQPINSRELCLWLVSDLYLHHQGQTTLIPLPELLGLPQGTEWKVDKSFIRSRRYSVFNAYRKHYDLERQVISRGSILHYQLPENYDGKAIAKSLSQGIGLNIESGLGQVIINPKILQGQNPSWEKVPSLSSKSQTLSVKKPDSVLITILENRQQHANWGNQPRIVATQIFIELCKNVTTARRYHAIAKGIAFENGKVPSRTQFGKFKSLANQYRNDIATLWFELTNPTNGILLIQTEQEHDIHQRGRLYQRSGWELSYGNRSDEKLGKWLQGELFKYKTEDYFSNVLAELAVLGLSDQWEKCCLGLDKQAAQQGENA